MHALFFQSPFYIQSKRILLLKRFSSFLFSPIVDTVMIDGWIFNGIPLSADMECLLRIGKAIVCGGRYILAPLTVHQEQSQMLHKS